MATKISNLADAGSLDGSELTPLVKGGSTVKASYTVLAAFIKSVLGLGINDISSLGTTLALKQDANVNTVAGVTGAQPAIDMTGKNFQRIVATITGNASYVDCTNLTAGCKIELVLVYTGTYTVTLSTGWTFSGGNPNQPPGTTGVPTFPGNNGQTTIIVAVYNGSALVCDQTRYRRVPDLYEQHGWLANQYIVPTVLGNLTGAVSIDARNSGVFEGVVTGNITSVTMSNLAAGMTVYLRLKMGGSGGYTVTLGSQWNSYGGPYAMPATVGDYLIITGAVSQESVTAGTAKLDYTAIASVSGRVSLGYYTWADLQTAYANGGGALAALPLGSTALVNMGSETVVLTARSTSNGTTPNAWVPDGWRVLKKVAGTLGAPNQTLSANAAVQLFTNIGVTLPANFLQVGMRLRLSATLRRTGTANAVNIRPTVGAANSNADTFFASLGFTATANQDMRIFLDLEVRTIGASATLGGANALGANAQNTAQQIEVTGLDTTAALYLNLTSSAITSPDTVILTDGMVEVGA